MSHKQELIDAATAYVAEHWNGNWEACWGSWVNDDGVITRSALKLWLYEIGIGTRLTMSFWVDAIMEQVDRNPKDGSINKAEFMAAFNKEHK